MTLRLRTTFNFIFGLILTVFLLYTAFRGTNFSSLWEVIQSVNIWWVLMAIPLLLFSHYLRAWRWQLLLVPVKNKVRLENAFSSLLIGYMANNILPRAGEIVRPYSLGKIENISKASALGSVVLERLIDLISLLIGLGIMFLFYRTLLIDSFPWLNVLSLLAIIASALFLIVLILLLNKRTWMVRVTRLILYPFPEKFKLKGEQIFHSFVDGMSAIQYRHHTGGILMLSIVMWISYIFMAYVPLLAFDLGTATVDLFTGFVLTMVTSISVIVPTPGATGAYHTFTAETLTRVYGIQREVALGYATLTHAAGYFSVIFVGLFYLIRYNFKLRELLRDEEYKGNDTYEGENE